jgi:argonaute-like protein implicated in RNA metabolism and viral defense
MYIKREVSSFEELRENSWSGAVDTLNRIEELGLENEFMEILEEGFYNCEPTETELNDFIWFETDEINNLLGRNTSDLFEDEEEEVDA